MADVRSNLPTADQSDGATGSAVPSNAIQVAGTNNSGNLTALNLDSSSRLLVTNFTGNDTNYGTAGANTLRTASQIGNSTGAADFNSGTTGAQTLRVQANQGAAGSSGWLTSDITNTSCIYTHINVTTTATQLKVGASNLANRKIILFQPLGGDIYYGFDSSVTTTSGMLVKKGQTFGLPVGASINVYAIASSGSQDTRVQELS
jgi:hypothetical protein